jgi:hypothetical protein
MAPQRAKIVRRGSRVAGESGALCAVLEKLRGALGAVRAVLDLGFGNCCLGAFVVVEGKAGEGFVGEAGGLAELGVGEALALTVEDQLGVINEGHAMGVGKLLGAGSDEVDVRTFFEDEASGLNGIAETLDAGHAARFHAASVHEKGVELDAAIGGEKAATAGVEGGIVFKDGDGSFDCIESRAAEGEDVVAGFKGVADPGFVGDRV